MNQFKWQQKMRQKLRAKPEMVCPHCNTKGTVQTYQAQQKQGISGGKATAAVMTAGVSMLGTGLSRKQSVTQANCTKCGTRWVIQ